MVPKVAENPANKVLVVPTDYAGLVGLATTLGNLAADGVKANGVSVPRTAGEAATRRSPAPTPPHTLTQNQAPATTS
jgi:hypothetical protein